MKYLFKKTNSTGYPDKDTPLTGSWYIHAKPSYNSDTVSGHFNRFYCMEICIKLRRDLAMLTYT